MRHNRNQSRPGHSPLPILLFESAEHSHFPDGDDFAIGIDAVSGRMICRECDVSVHRPQLEMIRKRAGTWRSVLAVRAIISCLFTTRPPGSTSKKSSVHSSPMLSGPSILSSNSAFLQSVRSQRALFPTQHPQRSVSSSPELGRAAACRPAHTREAPTRISYRYFSWSRSIPVL
jgi:hypothetical protein